MSKRDGHVCITTPHPKGKENEAAKVMEGCLVKISRCSMRSRGIKLLVVILVAGWLTALGSSVDASASRPTQQKGIGKWQKAIDALSLPGKGCFTAFYPKIEWLPSPCQSSPPRPMKPTTATYVGGAVSLSGNGDGHDYLTEVRGSMSSVTGTIGSVTPGTTEKGYNCTNYPYASCSPTEVANSYSIQLNSVFFTSPECSGIGAPGCMGWQQFVYNSEDNQILIQYWVYPTDGNCPTTTANLNSYGWQNLGNACYGNSPEGNLETTSGAVAPVPQPSCPPNTSLSVCTPLTGVTLKANVSANGDSVLMTTASGTATAVSTGSEVLGLAGNWSVSEFGIYGDSGGDEAYFMPATVGQQVEVPVQTTENGPTDFKLTCLVPEGLTGESNNLNLPEVPTMSSSGSPTMTVDQTSTPPANPPSCVNAVSNGETHLNTFQGLAYDFQASGDFVDATTGPNFIVQARQVPVPTYPLVTFNQGIAAQIGTSDVAVCDSPQRLFVDGSRVNLADGTQSNLPGGGDVSLNGNGTVYLISGTDGDWVSATIVPSSSTYPYVSLIDLGVGLGQWPTSVQGLLANAGDATQEGLRSSVSGKDRTNVRSIESSGGTVLTSPFNFNEFYGVYTNSWRVPSNQSLLNVCGGEASIGIPQQVFYAKNLGASAKPAQAICRAAGVTVISLLNDCTVDVVVLGKSAAAVYAEIPTPVKWGKIKPSKTRACASRSVCRMQPKVNSGISSSRH